MKKTAKIILTADCAREYGFVDEDGVIHGDIRSVKSNLRRAGWHTTASLVPEFVKVPSWMIYYLGYKF